MKRQLDSDYEATFTQMSPKRYEMQFEETSRFDKVSQLLSFPLFILFFSPQRNHESTTENFHDFRCILIRKGDFSCMCRICDCEVCPKNKELFETFLLLKIEFRAQCTQYALCFDDGPNVNEEDE